MEIGKVNKLRDMPDFTERNAGTHTDYYEISKEEYDRITSIDNYRGKLNSEYEKRMPDWIRWGYGFYGANVTDRDGHYYYTICTGNSANKEDKMNEIISVLEEVAEDMNEYQKELATNEGIGFEIAAASVESAKGIVQDRILEEKLKILGLKQ